MEGLDSIEEVKGMVAQTLENSGVLASIRVCAPAPVCFSVGTCPHSRLAHDAGPTASGCLYCN